MCSAKAGKLYLSEDCGRQNSRRRCSASFYVSYFHLFDAKKLGQPLHRICLGLVTPLLSKLSNARSADAEVSGMDRVTEEDEEERGKVELSRVRKKGEWKSRRSELMQILAPVNLEYDGRQ